MSTLAESLIVEYTCTSIESRVDDLGYNPGPGATSTPREDGPFERLRMDLT